MFPQVLPQSATQRGWRRAISPLTRALRAGALTLLCLLATATGSAQDTAPGAMRPNGNFFMLRPNLNGLEVHEWVNGPGVTGVWAFRGEALGLKPLCPPAGLTSSAGFHFTANNGGSTLPRLFRWEPGVGFLSAGVPNTHITKLSTPSEVMYGNRVMIVAGEYLRTSGSLNERFLFGATAWNTFPQPLRREVSFATPCVRADGSVFVVNDHGEVVQMWWNTSNNSWNWYGGHGAPSRSVKAVSIGAAMPATDKVFVTCNDGSLRQIFWWNGAWHWHNHGKPFGYSVDAPAVAVADGKLFVTATSGGDRILAQLYWDGSTWIWFSHGAPRGTKIISAPAAAMGGDNVAVLCLDGNYYMTFWTGTTWAWKNTGRP